MHGQLSFDDLGTPLSAVTFVVLDLETTGTSPTACAITEIGAVKVRGGEVCGRFHTLVNPGQSIPPVITYLTGITETMVGPAPTVEAVLPALLEFVAGAVIVGHNIRFDLSFIAAALRRGGYPPLGLRSVDTCALARRLVRDDVPDCRLGTLAAHFRTVARPTHRALDDAEATVEVFHALLERAGRLHVLALDDLMDLPTVKGHPQVAKLRLTGVLPRRPGVYLFRDAGGRVLYVGKAVNLRRRVRSYFTGGGDERRKSGALLREVAAIDHIECSGELEASVLEVRLIQQFSPRYNRQAKLWRRYVYVRLTLDERFPRLAVATRVRPGDRCWYVGPLPSRRAAQLVIEAVESVLPLRRCRHRPGRQQRPAPCTPAQLGVATCPCAGDITEAGYAEIVDRARRALGEEPALVLGPLERRMRALAGEGRYEEAADVRDRAGALARAVTRQERLSALFLAGELLVEGPAGERLVVRRGQLVESTSATGAVGPTLFGVDPGPSRPQPVWPLAPDLVDEVLCVDRWLDRQGTGLRVLSCEGGLAWPARRLPDFEPAR